MKRYKHDINEGFSNALDSSLIDYSEDLKNADFTYKKEKITSWMNTHVLQWEPYARASRPSKRWRLRNDLTIPIINDDIRFKFTICDSDRNLIENGLTNNGEIPDFIQIDKISQYLYINNSGAYIHDTELRTFKNFPKIVTHKLIFESIENLMTLKDIPIIDLRNSKGGNLLIDFSESCNSIGSPSHYCEDLFRQILHYCDFIKGSEYSEDRLKIKYGSGHYSSADRYWHEGYLWKLGGHKKYFDVMTYYNTVGGMRTTKLVHFTLDSRGNLIEDKDW